MTDIERATHIVRIAAIIDATFQLADLKHDGFAMIQLSALLLDRACEGAKRTHAQGLRSLARTLNQLAEERARDRAATAEHLTDALVAAMREGS